MRFTRTAALLIVLSSSQAIAQTRPTQRDGDIVVGGKASVSTGYLLPKGEVSAAMTYFNDTYDRFWVGKEEMDLPPVLKEITTQGLAVNLNWGLTDDLQFTANVPYTHVQADLIEAAAPPQAALGDIELGLQWRFTSLGAGRTDLLALGSVRFPADDYEPNLPVAIGDHTTDLYVGGVAFSRWSDRLFTSVLGTFGLRSDDAPNDFRYILKAGLDGRSFSAAVRYEQQLAFDGTDIMGGPFPGNKGEYKKVGAGLFVRPMAKVPVGLTGDLRWIVDGRNIGKAFGYSLGVVIDAHTAR